jgi:formylmethanofuran dehydrogenase subunit E
MGEPIIPKGNPDIVNLSESRRCYCCGELIPKRKQMWKYPDGDYVCISCRTRFDTETQAHCGTECWE